MAKAGASISAEPKPATPSAPLPPAHVEESVKNWLAFRENQKQVPADESLKQWLAFRESQKTNATAPTPAMGGGDKGAEPADGNSRRGRKNDLSL